MDDTIRLIEKNLPLQEISLEAKKEKLGLAKPRISEMHYWWGRKPLSTNRAVILGSILSDKIHIENFRDNWLNLPPSPNIRKIRLFKESPLIKISEEERKKFDSEIKQKEVSILDLFGGGGSIGFEALRLGLDVSSNDYNPVASLIQRATLYYPIKFGNTLVNLVEKYINNLENKLRQEMVEYYPLAEEENIFAYLWVWNVRCNACNNITPLSNNWKLRPQQITKTNHYEPMYVQPLIRSNKLIFEIMKGGSEPSGTVINGKGTCLFCKSTIENKEIVKDIKENQSEGLYAVVLKSKDTDGYKLSFREPNSKDFLDLEEKLNLALEINLEHIPENYLPIRSFATARYLKNVRGMFNSRQLLFFSNFIKFSKELLIEIEESYDRETAIAIGHYYSCMISKLTNYNSRSAGWHFSLGVIRDTLAFRRPSMSWNHAEGYPFSGKSGSWRSVKKSILDALYEATTLLEGSSLPKIFNFSAADIQFEKKFDLIVTDPPYFNDVDYPELSEFFYVWQQKIMSDYSDVLGSCWESSNIQTSDALSSNHDRSTIQAQKGLEISFTKMNQLLKDNGRLGMYFAHSAIESWEFVVNALIKTGWQITATYPMHTENLNSIVASGRRSMYSSIFIVAKKRSKNAPRGRLLEIQKNLQQLVEPRIADYYDGGIRGADLAMASMGAVLEQLTSYSSVKAQGGNLTIEELLSLSREYHSEFMIKRELGTYKRYDPPTMFYLSCLFDEVNVMGYDTALILSRSLKLDLEGIEKSYLIDTGNSKQSNRKVWLQGYDQRFSSSSSSNGNKILPTSIINLVHLCLEKFGSQGVASTLTIVEESPFTVTELAQFLKIIIDYPPIDKKPNKRHIQGAPGNDYETSKKLLQELVNTNKISSDYLETKQKGQTSLENEF